MYRADRFNRINHSDRGPIVFAACTILVLGVGIACAAGRDKNKHDSTTTSSSKVADPQHTMAGEVAKRDDVVQQAVTLASAQDAYAKRHYREAAASLDDYVQKHPKNSFAHYMLGLSAWKSGDLEKARAAFERSLALDSANVKTLLNLSRVLLDQGRVDEAYTRVNAAVQIDSSSAEVRRMMARVQSARGQRDSAISSYRLALSIDPSDSWSMNNLGLLLIEQGRYEDALPPLARAVELRPEAPAFANNLGVALERTGHARAAADALHAALAADSTYTKAAVSLARVQPKMDGDSTTIDVSALAASFNRELQSARETRLATKSTTKPDSVKPPEW